MAENKDEREKVCASCHRTESRTGKMLKVPGGLYICLDCLQKTVNMFENGDFNGIPGMPPMAPFMFPGMPGGFGADDTGGLGDINNPDFMGNIDEIDSDGASGTGSDGATANGADGLAGEKSGGPTAISAEGAANEVPIEVSSGKAEDKKPKPRMNISFINLADLQNGFGRRQQIKKKKERTGPVLDPEKVLPPHKLKAALDEYVIGQDKAKKSISVAVYNHYKRVLSGKDDDIEIEKSNMLMLGPTGCGKTYLVRTLARLLDVPLAITDATSLTEAGYIGDDIESVISKLLAAADNDVERAEVGIVFIDEIDKIAKKSNLRSRDVSGESVQQGLLKLLEGSEVDVPVGASSKNAMVPLTTVNTRNILFICGGAFPDLDEIIKERLTKKSSIGFNAELKDKFEGENLLQYVTNEDLRKYGMIPEFLGRLPVTVALNKLTTEMLVEVLKEPRNAILKQYQKLLLLDEVDLVFEDEALFALAERAQKQDTGARGLRSVIEEIMLDIMYEIPKDDSIGRVTITREYIEGAGAPLIEIRGTQRLKKAGV